MFVLSNTITDLSSVSLFDEIIHSIRQLFVYDTFILLVYRSLFALIWILVGFLAIKLVRYFIGKVFRPKKEDVTYLRRINTLESISLSISKYLIYFIIVYQVLTTLSGKNLQPLLAVAGVGSVAIGLGAQNLVKDVISGFFILSEDQMAVGDIVEVQSHMGTVESIGIRTTSIRGFSGELFIIPNGNIDTIINWTNQYAKANFKIQIPYEEDAQKVLHILEKEMKRSVGIEGLVGTPTVQGISDFKENSVEISIIAECNVGLNWAVERELRLRIKTRFDKEGIRPPYSRTHLV